MKTINRNFDYDALVTVHPDSGRPKNQYYKHNLAALVKLCRYLGKPVFVVDDDCPIEDNEIKQMLSDSYNVPVATPEKLGKDFITDEEKALYNQNAVNFISKVIGKKPEEIRLAFGGIYAEACVHDYASSWCKDVDTIFGIFSESEPCENPISYGKILTEIV